MDTKYESDSAGKTVSALLFGVAVTKGLVRVNAALQVTPPRAARPGPLPADPYRRPEACLKIRANPVHAHAAQSLGVEPQADWAPGKKGAKWWLYSTLIIRLHRVLDVASARRPQLFFSGECCFVFHNPSRAHAHQAATTIIGCRCHCRRCHRCRAPQRSNRC